MASFKDLAVVESHKEAQTTDNANFANLFLPILVLIIIAVSSAI